MNKKEQTATMYESIPAVAELNKVPGFNPLRLIRRIISPESGEEMMQLDLRYKKLWFRLANPKGRIRLNALRITEQMAIYEAQVFLERTDENPIASFTSSCTKEDAPGGKYIQAAQQEAMDEALSDAGYGIQFADMSAATEGSRYGSRIPLKGTPQNKDIAVPASNAVLAERPQPLAMSAPSTVTASAAAGSQEEKGKGDTAERPDKSQEPVLNSGLPVEVQTEDHGTAQSAETVKLPAEAAEQKSLPVQKGAEMPAIGKSGNVLPVSGEKSTEEDTGKAVQGMLALLGGQNAPAGTALPVGGNTESSENKDGKEPVQEQTDARYTPDMPVEEIVKLMTFEEAGKVVVDTGVCKGQTIAEVAERRPPSLKFYLYGGYKGDNNILRAAARIMLDSLAAKKAG